MKKTALLLLLCAPLLAQEFKFQGRINEFIGQLPELRKKKNDSTFLSIDGWIKQSKINDSYKLGHLYFWKAEFQLDRAMYDSAGFYYQSSLPWLEKDADEATLGRAYIGAGYILNFQAKYSLAMAFNLKAEKIFRRIGDQKMLARSLKRLGDDLALQDSRAAEAKKYYQESIAISVAQKDTLNIIRATNALTTVFSAEKNYPAIDSALEKAVSLAKKINCLRCQAISFSQWGISDYEQGKFTSAIRRYKEEFEVNKLLGATYDQFFVYQNTSDAYIGLKNYDKAIQYSDSALKIVQTDVAWNHYFDVYQSRYNAYKGKGDLGKALIALEKQMQYKDSVLTESKEKALEELNASYNFERKERQINDLVQLNKVKTLEATAARQWQVGLGIILFLIIILVFVLYNRYHFKKKAAQILDAKNTELQKLNGFKDRMFAVISHDLRNPVDAFSTIIESLNQNLQHASKEELKEFLGSTLDSAKDLKSLLNNLLEWSLVQIGKLPFDPKLVPLKTIVQESVSHLESMASLKKISIVNSVEEELVLGDREMITIIIRNLVSNAIKFSPSGKVIELKSVAKNGNVTLSVIDEGVGMNSEELNKLFKQEENVRTIGSSSAKGAGIGLLLCKELTEKNAGKIYAESKPNKGSTFYLELPTA
jgi:signal transduction histidine kinase